MQDGGRGERLEAVARVSLVRQDLQTIGRGERSVTPVLDGQHHPTPQGLQKISMFSSATPAGLGILGSFLTGVFNPCLYSVSLAGTFVTPSISPVAAYVMRQPSPLERGRGMFIV